MRRIAVFVVSFITWCLLVWPRGGAAGGWDGQGILVGLAAAVLVAFVFPEALAEQPSRLIDPRRWFWLICYIPVFAYYCIKANLQVVYLVLHPRMPIKPGIVRVRTKLRSSAGITALANSIPLTPGTLTVDADEQEGVLYVHWISVETTDDEEATQAIVKRFEGFLKRIIE